MRGCVCGDAYAGMRMMRGCVCGGAHDSAEVRVIRRCVLGLTDGRATPNARAAPGTTM